MDRLVYEAADQRATEVLGAALAEALPDGSVVALYGTLGAGKTHLVQAVAAACGVDRREVTSPTFMLVHEYHARRTVYHFDAYRLTNPEEFLELGPEEYFESGGIVLIEWADRVEAYLPGERLDIRIEITGDSSRRFALTASGEEHVVTIRRLAERLAL